MCAWLKFCKSVQTNEIRALMIEKGLPTFYVTINPADIYNLILKFISSSEFDLDNLLSEDIPDFWMQSVLVAKNLVVASHSFHLCMMVFIQVLLCYIDGVTEGESGVLGHVNAYYGCVEAQGQGSLHCHMLVWLLDSLNCGQIKDHVLQGGDTEFRGCLLMFLDDIIKMAIPDDCFPDVDAPHHSV